MEDEGNSATECLASLKVIKVGDYSEVTSLGDGDVQWAESRFREVSLERFIFSQPVTWSLCNWRYVLNLTAMATKYVLLVDHVLLHFDFMKY